MIKVRGLCCNLLLYDVLGFIYLVPISKQNNFYGIILCVRERMHLQMCSTILETEILRFS